MALKPWFPTFIYDAPLQRADNAAFVRLLLGECQRVREEDSEGRHWCQTNYAAGYTSYGTRRNLHRSVPSFVQLEQKIWPHVQRFADGIDMDLREANLAMTDCWVNFMSLNASHPAHVHPGAVVSGTLYVSTPEGCSGISFDDPRLDKTDGTPPKRAQSRPQNRRQISYHARAGKLILFESWLRHAVASNPATGERVSVSFNYTWV